MADEDVFYKVSNKLRIQLNNLQGQIIKETNISKLEKEASILEQCMKELTAAQEELERNQSSAIQKMTFYTKFEEMSRETNQILAQAGQAIQQLRFTENEDRRSAVTHRSKSSHLSRLSRTTLASTSSSARLHQLNLEEEIATLRAKINLMERHWKKAKAGNPE